MTDTKKIKLKIEGMHCNSCAMLIDGDLEDSDGVKKAETSYQKNETIVEFDETKIDAKEILEVVKQTGYTAKVLKD